MAEQEGYTWTQTTKDLEVAFELENREDSKKVSVSISRTEIHAGVKGEDAVIKGKLWKPVETEESTWSVEDGRKVVIYLQKSSGPEWWPCVVEGGRKIDTTKCVPDASSLCDLTGETRQIAEKMLFDQRQKAQGKPTSDEIEKTEKLKEFQRKHPELDFSKSTFQ
ncbi:MAG: nuclear movement protein nudC [Amphiamblys sp. WSBS2006]|nr:MAG: nuclear movement protein nudC [Amphiamblys sp. WSBS2006]